MAVSYTHLDVYKRQVLAVDPLVEPCPVLGFVETERLLGYLKSSLSVKSLQRGINVQRQRIFLVDVYKRQSLRLPFAALHNI